MTTKYMLVGLSLFAALGLASQVVAEQPAEPARIAEAPAEDVEAEMDALPRAPQSLIPSQNYNYYYPAAPSGMIPTRLYLAPRHGVPPFVGRTYITYPAFAPHEWLWVHSRGYYRTHPDGATTITTIHWAHE